MGAYFKDSKNDQLYIDFLCKLEGWKTRCKNLHWAAPKKNIHVYLDEFLDVISDYQDGLAEGIMGILGRLDPLAINGTPCKASNAIDFIREVKDGTCEFYDKISNYTEYVGIKSECETLIQNINKYIYLFNLCDFR